MSGPVIVSAGGADRRGWVAAAPRLAVMTVLALVVWVWLFCRSHVGPGETLRVTRSFGRDNPAPSIHRVIPATEELAGVQGVQEQVYGEGNYFFNPFIYKTEVDAGSLVTIKPGQIGLVSSQSGKDIEAEGAFLVTEPGYKGTHRRVLTPGSWRINPQAYKVEVLPATIIEPGYVGVLTSQTGTKRAGELAEIGEQGVMRQVLHPGHYHVNPKAYKVDVVEVGYREHTIDDIKFPSKDGYPIECDITVVWGIHPNNAPHIVKNIGKSDEEITRKVLDQVVQSASRNKGGEFSASELVSGGSRERFVNEFTSQLRDECETTNHIEILLGLIRNIEIPQDLRQPIQERQIQKEREKTLVDQQRTQEKRNELQRVQGDVAKMIQVTEAETTKKVAEARESGLKEAAEIRAKGETQIAEIRERVAMIEAKIDRALGEGRATETKLLQEAEADRLTQIVQAFGSAEAFTRYTFAKNLPEGFAVVLRYSGPGTLWTDLPGELRAFERAAALKVLEKAQAGGTPAGK